MLFSIWVRALRFFFPFILCLCSSGAAHAALAFGTPESPTPASGTTRQSAVTTLSWWVYRGIGSGLKYDLYWGTDPAPPLKASNISLGNSNYGSYPLGMTSYSTTFYWRVIVRDQQGAYAAGPVWSYTTKASNESPDSPTLRSPVNGELDIPVNPTLDYYSYDFEDYNAVNFDVFLAGEEREASTDQTGKGEQHARKGDLHQCQSALRILIQPCGSRFVDRLTDGNWLSDGQTPPEIACHLLSHATRPGRTGAWIAVVDDPFLW